MDLKTLDGLKQLRAKDENEFHHALDATGDRMNFLKLVYGYDFWHFHEKLPDHELDILPEFFEMYHDIPEEPTRAIAWLGEYIERGLNLEKAMEENPLDWNSDEPVLSKRIATEIIQRSGYLDNYLLGLIAKQRLVDFRENFEPGRNDYYKSSIIMPKEFSSLMQKHGKMVVFNSLRPGEELQRKLLAKKDMLAEYLLSLNIVERIHPNEMNQQMRRLAIELYGRTECAVKDICGHSFTLSSIDIIEDAYKLIMDNGPEGIALASDHLSLHKFNQAKINRIITSLLERSDEYRGFSSNVNTSRFELQIESMLQSGGVFYRRQVPYNQITRTNRRYIMDFLVGDTIIEVTDDSDGFIHDLAYFATLQEKTLLAKQAGYNILVITPHEEFHSQLKEAMQRSYTPKEAYDMGTFSVDNTELLRLATEKNSARNIQQRINTHFVNNVYMIGHIKAA
ncbi:hypothetical protein H6503_05595 [Candidatus Woesearchaeota archaeon]|nr:hypothetical protein [Candidatus Woesearchaeota archaeon]